MAAFIAGSKIAAPVAEFFPTEDAHGYFHLLRRLLRRYGFPFSFYGDKHGVFVRNDDHWTVEEQLAGKRQPTQFGRALAQLGVTYIPANSPQAKGRIERLWGTFEVPELMWQMEARSLTETADPQNLGHKYYYGLRGRRLAVGDGR
jgi:hypothetical protein